MDELGKITTENFIRTVTTKQDRHPNSGNIYIDTGIEGRGKFRYLTPRECLLFMGFTDEDFHKAEQVNSNTQLYKQAGNSICAPVLEAIFSNLL